MDKMWQILMVLVGTLCLTILVGLIGVFYGKVDAQFIEGLVSGTLVTLITILIKDITGQAINPTSNENSTTTSTTTATTTPKKEVVP
jgi:glycerol uptake facilitator-like aquaporin